MVRIPYGVSRIVGLRWRDVANSLEWEHRSDVSAKEEIDRVWLREAADAHCETRVSRKRLSWKAWAS